MKILVTGACGYVMSTFIGLCLSKNYKVLAVDNYRKGNTDVLLQYARNPNFEFMKGDICNEDDVKQMLKGVDFICNGAAIVGLPACIKEPILAKLTHVDGLHNLVKLKDKNVPLIQCSTGSVLGEIKNEVCTELTKPAPLSIYGKTKLLGESVALEYPNTVAFRYATGFGATNTSVLRLNLLINDLVYQAVHNKVLVVYQAHVKRTFIHIVDMGGAILSGFENWDKLVNTDYRVYNVGSESLNKTKKEIVDIIQAKTGCSVYMNEFAVDGDFRNYECSFEKFRKTIGWNTTITLDEGIDELIKVVKMIDNNNPRYL